jgi:enoyl-CoA hydratase/carnithine racemase
MFEAGYCGDEWECSAVGVGVTITLPMNIRVVSERAKIGFVFARRGIVMEVSFLGFWIERMILMER